MFVGCIWKYACLVRKIEIGEIELCGIKIGGVEVTIIEIAVAPPAVHFIKCILIPLLVVRKRVASGFLFGEVRRCDVCVHVLNWREISWCASDFPDTN